MAFFSYVPMGLSAPAKLPRARAVLIFLGALVVILMASRLWPIMLHIGVDRDEGWNAYHALHAYGIGGVLYPSPDALTGNNYPPLAPYFLGAIGPMFGDPLIAGRFVSVVSVLLVAAAINSAIQRMTGRDRWAAGIGTLVFLLFALTQFRDYFAKNDPQWLAHAVMMPGLLLMIPDQPEQRLATGRVILAALTVVFASLIKHNLIALPAAVTLWLLVYDRRAFAVWTLTGTVAVILAALICYHVYGPNFFYDIFGGQRYKSWWRSLIRGSGDIALLAPLTIAGFLLWPVRKTDQRIDLLLMGIVLAGIIGIIERTGQGVAYNAYFEVLIAAAIAAGVACSLRPGKVGDRWWKRPSVWAALPFIILIPLNLIIAAMEVVKYPQKAAAWADIIERTSAIPGAVACEDPTICFWAGKQFELDFFLYGQQAGMSGDTSVLERALVERRFTAIEMPRSSDYRPKFGKLANPIPPLVEKHYRLIFTESDGRRLYAPRP